jgi:hypothetical protein
MHARHATPQTAARRSGSPAHATALKHHWHRPHAHLTPLLPPPRPPCRMAVLCTCKRLKHMCERPELWRRIAFDSADAQRGLKAEGLLGVLSRANGGVEVLHLARCGRAAAGAAGAQGGCCFWWCRCNQSPRAAAAAAAATAPGCAMASRPSQLRQAGSRQRSAHERLRRAPPPCSTGSPDCGQQRSSGPDRAALPWPKPATNSPNPTKPTPPGRAKPGTPRGSSASARA